MLRLVGRGELMSDGRLLSFGRRGRRMARAIGLPRGELLEKVGDLAGGRLDFEC